MKKIIIAVVVSVLSVMSIQSASAVDVSSIRLSKNQLHDVAVCNVLLRQYYNMTRLTYNLGATTPGLKNTEKGRDIDDALPGGHVNPAKIKALQTSIRYVLDNYYDPDASGMAQSWAISAVNAHYPSGQRGSAAMMRDGQECYDMFHGSKVGSFN